MNPPGKNKPSAALQTCVFPVLIFIFGCINNTPPQTDGYKSLRLRMVDEQLVSRGISNKEVLDAMRKVERHLFVPSDQVKYAYEDHPLPIGCGQTISQPYIVAFMTEVLNLERNAKVLEIGTGSGYQAAILGEICDSVFSIEIVPELAERAAGLLEVLGYKNIRIKTGDGHSGWKEHAPYDAIIVTCAPAHVPDPLIRQLAEGGRMIIPVGERNVQELVLMTRKNGKPLKESVLPVRFVPMVDEGKKSY